MKTIEISKYRVEHDLLLNKVKLSREQWELIMFEFGWIYANQISNAYSHSKIVEDTLKFDKNFGYWEWFKAKWVLDDIALQETDNFHLIPYTKLKVYMLRSVNLENELITKLKKYL